MARQLAAKAAPELAELRGKFDRNEIGAADYTAKVAGAVAACELLVEQALNRNEPPLSFKANEARLDHQRTRIECRERIREVVSEFM
jgi:hypothetical protein